MILATSFPHKGTGLSTYEALRRIEPCGDRFSVFGTLNTHEDLGRQLFELGEYLNDRLIRGIKLYPGYQSFTLDNVKYFRIFELAKYYHVPVMIHGGELHHCCPTYKTLPRCREKFCPIDIRMHQSHPDSMVEAFKAYPDVRFVVSHLANPYFGSLRRIMSVFENVWTDISGQWVSGTEDTPEYRAEITAALQTFIHDKILNRDSNLIDRICFGTDFPIQSYKDSIGIVESLNLSAEDQKKVFYLNPSKLLGIWRTDFEVEAQKLLREFPEIA